MPIRIRCPGCQALMQVADGAAGKRTKCPKCGTVMAVPVARPAGTSPPGGGQPAGGAAASGAAASGAAEQPQKPQRQAAAPAPQGNVRQVRCPRCSQVMRGRAGAAVRCPKCQATVQIPAAAGPRPASTPQPAGGLDFDDLPPPSMGPSSFGPGGGGGFTGGGGPPRSASPYAFSGGRVARRGSLPSGRQPWHYLIPGIIFALFGALLVIGIVLSIVATVWAIAQGQVGEELVMVLVQLVGGLVISGPLAVVYIMGALAMIQRQGLSAARTAAVVACIPCFNCLILTPIGIWACILVFSEKAERDFHD